MKNINSFLQTLLLFLLGFLIISSGSIVMKSLQMVFILLFISSGFIALASFYFFKQYNQNKFINLIIGLISVWSCILIINNYDSFIVQMPQFISLFSLMIGLSLLIESIIKKERDCITIIKIILPFLYSLILVYQPIQLATVYIKLSGLGFIILSVWILIETVLEMSNKESRK